jgi:hypothetical protein
VGHGVAEGFSRCDFHAELVLFGRLFSQRVRERVADFVRFVFDCGRFRGTFNVASAAGLEFI